MKRKQNAKRKPKKTPEVGANESFLNTDHCGLDDLYDAEFGSRMEAETPQTEANKNGQQSCLGKREFNETTEYNLNTLHEMDIAECSNLSKNVGSLTTNFSMGFAPSNANVSCGAGLVQGERTYQTDSGVPHQDPRYKGQELNAALLVIRNIMKMNAAEPFNIPVDPIALGIPDYFDVIDTPMDLGTICNNLENGLKYVDSEDVFKDVQHIWENCCKYNKKGAYILELMKRVKNKFLKYWTAAGLYSEEPLDPNDSHLQCPTKSTLKRSTCGHTSYTNQQHDMTGMCHVPDHLLSQSYCHAHQPQQRACQCESSSRELQPSQPQAGTNIATAGCLHLMPPVESSSRRKCNKCRRLCPGGAVSVNPSNKQQCEMSPSQVKADEPSSSCSLLHYPHQRSCQCQSSFSQLHSSQLQADINTCRAGHLHLKSPMESTQSRSKCGQKCPVSPVTDNLGHQHQDYIHPSQVRSHQPSSTYSQANQHQQTHSQCQIYSSHCQLLPSLPQAGVNIGSTDSTSVQRRTRGPTRCLKLWRESKLISITTNGLGQPIGIEAPKLTSFLGTLARDGHLVPLTYVDWRAIPDANKENMWQQVQSKFDIDPKSKSWVLLSLAKKWRDWKAKLKAAHYNSHATDEERLADRDERVLPDQWSILISHWNSEEAEKRSARNRANRARQKFVHTTGTKSFARLREEQRAKRPDGKEPSRAELFILTRTRKNGAPVNKASSALIEKLRVRATQQETSQNSTARDDIFSQVIGEDRHGRVRTYGLGPSPSDIGIAKPTYAEAMKMVSQANSEVREVKEKMVNMEQICSQMAAQMASMMSMMSNMQMRFPDKNESDIAANNSNVVEGSPQHQLHSSPSHHAITPYETRARKRGKMQNACTN